MVSSNSNATSGGDGSGWEDDVISVTDSVASAYGTRHRPKTSIVEDFDALPDLTQQVGVLHIEVQRYLQEAKDQLGLSGRDRLGSGLHEDETDAAATQFDNAEESLLAICLDENPKQEPSEQTYRLGGQVDQIWESLDRGELGYVSISTVLKWLKKHETFNILNNFDALTLAFSCSKGATKAGVRKNITRRSWVSFREFLSLICHQFYAVRFWDIYERINDEGTGVAPPHDFAAMVDVREFGFILKRAGYKIDSHDPGPGEMTAMFEQCSPESESGPGKVALAEVVKVATIKRFFPAVDARACAQYAQPNGAKKRASKAPYGGKMTVGQVGRTKLKAKEARSRMANAKPKR